MATRKARTQSDKIRAMHTAGKTHSEIAKKLGIRYQIVWRTINRGLHGQPIPGPAVVEAVAEAVTE